MNISLIIPCYNEKDSLPILYKELCNVSNSLSDYNFEFIFVNDGSKDNTLSILKDFSSKDERVKYISFSRNFRKRICNVCWFL